MGHLNDGMKDGKVGQRLSLLVPAAVSEEFLNCPAGGGDTNQFTWMQM